MPSIFESKDTMPPADNSPDVARVALSMPEARRETTSTQFLSTNANVDNVNRPRFGHKAE